MNATSTWAGCLLGLVLFSFVPAMAAPPPLPIVIDLPPMDGPALARLATSAHAGDPTAQGQLGALYLEGHSLPQDLSAGAVWIQKSADQDWPTAEFELGAMYRLGKGGLTQDYAKAIIWLQKAADQDFGLAQDYLGDMYHQGQGVPKDDVEAFFWLSLADQAVTMPANTDANARERKSIGSTLTSAQLAGAKARVKAWKPIAPTVNQQVEAVYDLHESEKTRSKLSILAESGNSMAQFLFGMMYRKSNKAGDLGTAAAWLQKAADQGLASAQANLAAMYLDGLGVPKNQTVAAEWTRKAANQGLAYAQTDMGIAYSGGLGVPKDEAEARHWYRRAADQGDGTALYLLATGSLSDKASPEDRVQCYKWMALAAEYATDDSIRQYAQQNLPDIAAILTPAQLAEAKSQVDSWTPVFEVP